MERNGYSEVPSSFSPLDFPESFISRFGENITREMARRWNAYSALMEAIQEIEGHAANGGKGIITNLANVRRVARKVLAEFGS